METYVSKSLEFGKQPEKANTEPSHRGNSLEGVTTIEPNLALRLGETLEVAVSRSVNSSNAPMQRGITTVLLQECYNLGLTLSRKVYNTSSPTIALCKILGLDFNRKEIQIIREFLFDNGVQLKVGDKQCVDPTTKVKKSKAQSIIRCTESEEKKSIRISKLTQGRWDKSKTELTQIQEKQKKTIKETISVQMADKDLWAKMQASRQEKSAKAKAAMTEQKKQLGIEKWKKAYWEKTSEERGLINKKKSTGLNSIIRAYGITFHSSYELNMYEFLKALGIPFQYHTLTCSLDNYTWHPDFYLPGFNMILETKGKHPNNIRYWQTVTLPKIIKAKLWDRYDIRINWDRNVKKYTTLQEMLNGSERVSDIVCSL